jgi:ABC-type sugar transport system permease subunit
VIPILLYFGLFSFYPILSAFYISLHRWSLVDRNRPFVGVDNYVWVFRDPIFAVSLKNTLYYAVAYVVLCVSIGLILGTLVYGFKEPLKSIVQTICFIPVMTSVVIAAQLWEFMYAPGYGILNYLLSFIGLGPFMWARSSTQVIPAIVIMSLWKNVGYYMILFIAGLTTIPPSLYEAAWIDGASRWQAFWQVTLPLLMPTTLFSLVTGSIGAFQVFAAAVLLRAPGKSGYVMLQYLYHQGFSFFEMGRASAIAFVMFSFILLVTLFQMRLLRPQFQY